MGLLVIYIGYLDPETASVVQRDSSDIKRISRVARYGSRFQSIFLRPLADIPSTRKHRFWIGRIEIEADLYRIYTGFRSQAVIGRTRFAKFLLTNEYRTIERAGTRQSR